MIVFGDGRRCERARDKLAGVRELLAGAPSRGIGRHERLVAGLIEAGELLQALADDAFARAGEIDRSSAEADAATALCVALARDVRRSWRGEGPLADDDETEAALRELEALPLPDELDVRAPEGFAHYAVYPESYLAAAETLPRGPLTVIGLRSIGTTLAAVVAAAHPGSTRPITVRPVGHPFRRELRLHPDLAAAMRPAPGGAVAIVDEGPGLSGSSVAAVASRIEDDGVPLDRVHLLPSHAGEPGPEADDAIRRIWRGARRHVRSFDETVLGSTAASNRLEGWVADLVGAPRGPLVDISGGAWRGRLALPPASWPPVHGWGERRKFLLDAEGGRWLLKFAGLERVGRSKARLAAILSEAGFVPAHAGMRHGFVVERWRDDARPLASASPERGALLPRLGAYLGLRARAFPLEPGRGASPERLLAMARANAAEELGKGAARALDGWRPALDRLARRVRPVAVDARLHVWEWLSTPDGLLKADALDHHAGHDLVGCQDIAWDVVGAGVELGLSEAEVTLLAERVEREGGAAVDPELLAFLRPAYLAFQLGYWTFAQGGASDAAELGRLRAAARRYRDALGLELGLESAEPSVRLRRN